MFYGLAFSSRMTLPVRDGHTISLLDDGSAVVISLIHHRVGRVDILTIRKHSLERKVRKRKRNLETELDAHMTLIHAAHCEVRERVLRIIVEAHHLGLVLDRSIISGHTDIIAGIAVRIIQVSSKSLAGLQVRNNAVSCSR